MTYMSYTSRKVHQNIATLPPTPEFLITALSGKRFNGASHRRYYMSRESLWEWATLPLDRCPTTGTMRRKEVHWCFDQIDLYVDLRNLSVVLVRPGDAPYLENYAEPLLAGLRDALAKAVPRPRPCVNVLFS